MVIFASVPNLAHKPPSSFTSSTWRPTWPSSSLTPENESSLIPPSQYCPAMDSKSSRSNSAGDKEPGDYKPPPRRRSHAPRFDASNLTVAAASGLPCGACKFLRRKCLPGCVFAPHFVPEQGPARFAAVHKVFGASNVSKLLLNVPVERRHDAVVTICYEAQARLSDPVYGCVSTILAMQQQVTLLQTELSIVHTQLLNSQLAIASAFQGSQQAAAHRMQVQVLQPAYSNISSSSAADMDVVNVVGSFNDPASLDRLGDTTVLPLSSDHFQPLDELPHCPCRHQDIEEEETSHNIIPVSAFANQRFGPN